MPSPSVVWRGPSKAGVSPNAVPVEGSLRSDGGVDLGGGHVVYLGHLLIENRPGLIADAMATVADGFGEREAATLMMHAQWQHAPWRRRTLGADKGYDDAQFVGLMREVGVTPHVTQNLTRPGGSAIDGRTTRHDGYAITC